jgi:hypothetical protein
MWEYTYATGDKVDMWTKINNLGMLDWELVSVTHDNGITFTAWLKRKLT